MKLYEKNESNEYAIRKVYGLIICGDDVTVSVTLFLFDKDLIIEVNGNKVRKEPM